MALDPDLASGALRASVRLGPTRFDWVQPGRASYGFAIKVITRREAADSALARQGEATQ